MAHLGKSARVLAQMMQERAAAAFAFGRHDFNPEPRQQADRSLIDAGPQDLLHAAAEKCHPGFDRPGGRDGGQHRPRYNIFWWKAQYRGKTPSVLAKARIKKVERRGQAGCSNGKAEAVWVRENGAK